MIPVDGTWVGRVWVSEAGGPTIVTVRDGDLFDLSRIAPTCSQLLELENPVASIRECTSMPRVASAETTQLLAPCDLQAIKASGVTFVASLLERVIEEQARGDARKAD